MEYVLVIIIVGVYIADGIGLCVGDGDGVYAGDWVGTYVDGGEMVYIIFQWRNWYNAGNLIGIYIGDGDGVYAGNWVEMSTHSIVYRIYLSICVEVYNIYTSPSPIPTYNSSPSAIHIPILSPIKTPSPWPTYIPTQSPT